LPEQPAAAASEIATASEARRLFGARILWKTSGRRTVTSRSWYPIGSNEANFVTSWDIRVLLRALGAALLGLVVVWLVTAASDEGQLTAGARAGRTLPLVPLCSAVGAALALGTARVRQESRAFEALGRSPAETGRASAIGAALPSLAIGAVIALVPSIDVAAFYPRPAGGDAFVETRDGYVSATLGVRIDAEGDTHPLDASAVPPPSDAGLPRGARGAAAGATALAGISLALVTTRAVLRRSLLDRRARRRMRTLALLEGAGCAVLMLVAFQAAAARVAPPFAALVPPAALLALALARLRGGYGAVFQLTGRQSS
jgi:hypothetical protein